MGITLNGRRACFTMLTKSKLLLMDPMAKTLKPEATYSTKQPLNYLFPRLSLGLRAPYTFDHPEQ